MDCLGYQFGVYAHDGGPKDCRSYAPIAPYRAALLRVRRTRLCGARFPSTSPPVRARPKPPEPVIDGPTCCQTIMEAAARSGATMRIHMMGKNMPGGVQPASQSQTGALHKSDRSAGGVSVNVLFHGINQLERIFNWASTVCCWCSVDLL